MFDAARGDGLQGDRGRLPLGLPARLRLRPRQLIEEDLIPDDVTIQVLVAVPPGADRAHLRVHWPGARAGHRPLLQLDLDAAAPGRVRPGPGRDHRHRRQRRPAVPQARGSTMGDRRPLRVLARELHRHRARVRRRDLRGGDGRHRADARATDHPQPAGHRRDVHAQRLRRRDRVVRPHHPRPRLDRPQPAPAQRPRLRRWPPPSSACWPAPTASRARCSATASAPATSTSSRWP